MKTLIHQLEAAGLWVKLERGNWYPQLEAAGQYFQQKSGFPASDWMSLTLILRVPIYDGGVTKANVAKAKEDVRQVELLDQTLRRTIDDQVDSAYHRLPGRRAPSSTPPASEPRPRVWPTVRWSAPTGSVRPRPPICSNATTEATDAETSQIVARVQREFQAIFLRYAVGLPPLPDLDFRQTSQADPQEN